MQQAQEQTENVLGQAPDELRQFNASDHRREVGPLLDRVSRTVRDQVHDRARDRVGADLIGAKLRGSDLHGAGLRGAYLLGADLRGADLQHADLLGADLRGADLRGAQLSSSLFLTQPQLDAATGDTSTTIPAALQRPLHWSSAVIAPADVKTRSHRRRR
ncbi:MAG: pentapeptide repeat-containing protein [Actinomycetota bacterium]|nr:pentapeptide repeat-containing protein [Actinomycetota bacterium]